MKRLILIACCALAGCGKQEGSSTPSASPTSGPQQATSADLAFCVSETNRYRASVGRPPLTQASDVEAFAAEAAKADQGSGTPHGYYLTHPSGFSAENEVLRWAFTSGTVRDVIANAIAFFWSEGPSGGHYQNIVGSYTRIGCGVFIANSAISVVEDFR